MGYDVFKFFCKALFLLICSLVLATTVLGILYMVLTLPSAFIAAIVVLLTGYGAFLIHHEGF